MSAARRVFAIRSRRLTVRQLAFCAAGVVGLVVLAVALMPVSGWLTSLRATAGPEVYTVAPGETLNEISDKVGVPAETLVALNDLPSADLIQAGQQLITVAPSEQAAARGGTPEQVHLVVAGENLWDIARTYGVEFEALLDRNALPDADLLAPGQKLVIPSTGDRAESSTRSGERANANGRIWVPFRTQLDGLPSAGSNCGPASLGMAMSFFGEWWLTAGIRRDVNTYQGTFGVDAGSSWEGMAYAARKRGFTVVGVVDARREYRQWTIDDLVQQTRAGRPVIVLARYWSLPGHNSSAWYGDHYILFVGLTPGGDVIYHDPAFPDEPSGAYRTMSREQFIRAWTRTYSGLQYTAMALDWPGAEPQP